MVLGVEVAGGAERGGWTPAAEASIPAELTRSFAVFTQDGPADEVRWAEIDLQAKR